MQLIKKEHRAPLEVQTKLAKEYIWASVDVDMPFFGLNFWLNKGAFG